MMVFLKTIFMKIGYTVFEIFSKNPQGTILSPSPNRVKGLFHFDLLGFFSK